MDQLDYLLSRSTPFINPDEEPEVIRRAKEGSVLDRERLLTSNIKLVVKIARSHYCQDTRVDLLDLVQEGSQGLLESINTYNPDKGTRFTTHAGWRIRARVLRFIVHNIRLVRVKRGESERIMFQLSEAKNQLEAEGIDPTPEKLADILDTTPERIEEMQLRMGAPEASLDYRGSNADSDLSNDSRLDRLKGEYDPFAAVASKECCGLVNKRLREFLLRWNLSERDREILRYRILTDDPLPLAAIGDKFGLSRQRIQQIESALRDKVQRKLHGVRAELLDKVESTG